MVEYLFSQVDRLILFQFDRVSELFDGLKFCADCKVVMGAFGRSLDAELAKLMLKDDHEVQLVLQFHLTLDGSEDLITLQALYFEGLNC